ncbi:hypothetical protein GOODEAATRI_034571 [Goodea atripinnis]|uniref:Uncharacterized protein n=1 Tax=Goodea atripinnis TaxID=208336 RepID=A0ABV0PJG7_9TELE
MGSAVPTLRSCSTHLPVPCWLHPFLWVLHTIHHDQLATNMPSASTTGDTVPVIIKMYRVPEGVTPSLPLISHRHKGCVLLEVQVELQLTLHFQLYNFFLLFNFFLASCSCNFKELIV